MWILVGDRARQKITAELLAETGFLSVHQLCWWTALKAIEKCLRCGKPKWLMDELEGRLSSRRGHHLLQPFAKLKIYPMIIF